MGKIQFLDLDASLYVNLKITLRNKVHKEVPISRDNNEKNTLRNTTYRICQIMWLSAYHVALENNNLK